MNNPHCDTDTLEVFPWQAAPLFPDCCFRLNMESFPWRRSSLVERILSRQCNRPRYRITGGTCHKYHICRDKTFVATSILLSRRKTCDCRDKGMVAATKLLFATKVCLSWQNIFVVTKTFFIVINICRNNNKHFVATSILLSWQKMCFVATNTCLSRQKKIQKKIASNIVLSRQNFCCDKNYTCGNSRQWYSRSSPRGEGHVGCDDLFTRQRKRKNNNNHK